MISYKKVSRFKKAHFLNIHISGISLTTANFLKKYFGYLRKFGAGGYNANSVELIPLF